MQFVLANVDMDCGVTNPAIALAIVLNALLFGAWMAWVLTSLRSRLRKAISLALVLTGSVMGSWVAQGAAIQMLAAEFSSEPGRRVEVGCIGRPPALLSPAATVFCSWMFYSAWAFWFRARQTRDR